MSMEWMEQARKRIRRTLLLCTPLIFLGIFIPVIAICEPIIPANQEVNEWFQRSGSILVLLVVWLEVLTHSIDGYIYPSGMATSHHVKLKVIFKKYYLIIRVSTVLMAIAGTAIWGYGDLFFNGHNE